MAYGDNPVASEAVPGRVCGEFPVGEPADTTAESCDPEHSLTIVEDAADLVARQPLLAGVTRPIIMKQLQVPLIAVGDRRRRGKLIGHFAAWSRNSGGGETMKARLTLVLICCMVPFAMWPTAAAGAELVRIHGRVTDFNGTPQEGVVVHVKNEKFDNLYSTHSGKDGRYELMVERAVYYCIYAVRESEYRKTRLEYWAWNVPALADLEINPQYERLEIYALNAFKPQVTPHETFMVYFRPMSLSRQFSKHGPAGKPDVKPGDLVDIAPLILEAKDLDLRVNGERARIVSVSKVKEYARGVYLFGCVVQGVVTPGTTGPIPGYDLITLIAKDPETGDTGRADYFYRR